MAVPTSRDIAQTQLQLARLLEASCPNMREVTVTVLPSSAGTGFSSESILFDADFTDAGTGEAAREECVARVKPADYTLYQQHDLQSQWRVIDALQRNTEVPVPRILAHDALDGTWLGSPCFVMTRVAGQAAADSPPFTLKGWLKEATPQEQREVCERGFGVLAAIHAADWRALGLDFLLESTVNPVGLARQLDHDERFLAWISDTRDWPELQVAAAWLRANAPVSEDLRLSWGDSRLGNMLFRDFRPVAVLDWEMVTLASPAADLGWWLVFNHIHSIGIHRDSLPGFPSDEESVEIYSAAAGVDPAAVAADLLFYEVRAALRAAILLIRFSDAMVANGTLPPDAADRPYKPALNVLRHHLARG